jgi:hypothetical protein
MSEIDIKRWEIVIFKINIKSLLEKEIFKLENKIVISEIGFGMVPYEESQKFPIYEFRSLVTPM